MSSDIFFSRLFENYCCTWKYILKLIFKGFFLNRCLIFKVHFTPLSCGVLSYNTKSIRICQHFFQTFFADLSTIPCVLLVLIPRIPCISTLLPFLPFFSVLFLFWFFLLLPDFFLFIFSFYLNQTIKVFLRMILVLLFDGRPYGGLFSFHTMYFKLVRSRTFLFHCSL